MEIINIEDYGLSINQPKFMRKSTSIIPEIGEIFGKWKILTGPLRGKYRWGAICECQCEYKTRQFNVYNKLFTKESQSCGCLKEDNAKGSRLKNNIKKCTRCLVSKTPEYFNRNPNKKNGLEPHCKECEHLRSIEQKFKLAKNNYNEMLKNKMEYVKFVKKTKLLKD